MPLPVLPIASAALTYGSVALAAYTLARRTQPGWTDQRAEDAHDELADGAQAHRPRDRAGQLNAAARLRRVIRLGRAGPGVSIDASVLARLRIRRA